MLNQVKSLGTYERAPHTLKVREITDDLHFARDLRYNRLKGIVFNQICGQN